VSNNLFYGKSAPLGLSGLNHDYNYFVSFTGDAVPSEVHGGSASGNPFNNYPALVFTLQSNTPAGASLGPRSMSTLLEALEAHGLVVRMSLAAVRRTPYLQFRLEV